MAYELNVLTLPAMEADASLTGKQHYCVKKNATDNEIALCDTDGEIFLGVLQNEPAAANDAAAVMSIGISKVEAGEALTAGDFWGTDSSGKAKKVEHTNTGADIGDFIMGQVLEGAGSGELATVTVGFPITGRVEAA